MDEGNTSKSSSSTVQVSQGIRNLDSELCNETRQDENVIITTQEIEGPPAVQVSYTLRYNILASFPYCPFTECAKNFWLP